MYTAKVWEVWKLLNKVQSFKVSIWIINTEYLQFWLFKANFYCKILKSTFNIILKVLVQI